MFISERYILDETTRWKKEVENLNDRSIDKLKKTGVVKPEKEYMKGIETGNQKMMKKLGVKEKKAAVLATQYRAHTNTIQIPKNSEVMRKAVGSDKSDFEKDLPIYKRHEVEEAKATDRMKKRGDIAAMMNVTNRGNELVGQHASPAVLKNEDKITKITSKLYNRGTHLRNLRTASGEDTFAKMSGIQIRKLEEKIAKLAKSERIKLQKEISNIKVFKQKGLWKKVKWGLTLLTKKLAMRGIKTAMIPNAINYRL